MICRYNDNMILHNIPGSAEVDDCTRFYDGNLDRSCPAMSAVLSIKP